MHLIRVFKSEFDIALQSEHGVPDKLKHTIANWSPYKYSGVHAQIEVTPIRHKKVQN